MQRSTILSSGHLGNIGLGQWSLPIHGSEFTSSCSDLISSTRHFWSRKRCKGNIVKATFIYFTDGLACQHASRLAAPSCRHHRNLPPHFECQVGRCYARAQHKVTILSTRSSTESLYLHDTRTEGNSFAVWYRSSLISFFSKRCSNLCRSLLQRKELSFSAQIF